MIFGVRQPPRRSPVAVRPPQRIQFGAFSGAPLVLPPDVAKNVVGMMQFARNARAYYQREYAVRVQLERALQTGQTRGLRGYGFRGFGASHDAAAAVAAAQAAQAAQTSTPPPAWYKDKDGWYVVNAANGAEVYRTKNAMAFNVSNEQVAAYCTDPSNYDQTNGDILMKCCACTQGLPFGNCATPPPWTEVGAAMRGIPKAHGNISLGAHLLGSGLSELPSPDDFKPVNMLRIALTDPVKFTAINVAAMAIPGMSVYVMMFATPLGFLAAMADAGGWDQLWNSPSPAGNCDKPPCTFRDAVTKSLGDGIEFVVGWFIGGGLVAACVKAGLKTFARNSNDAATRMFAYALADASGDLALAIKQPEKFKNPDFYANIGQFFKKAARIAVQQNIQDMAAAAVLSGIGDALGLAVAPILMLVNSDLGTLSQRKDRAIDYVSDQVLGVKWSALKRIPRDQWGRIITVDVDTWMAMTAAGPNLEKFVAWMKQFSDTMDKLVRDGVAKLKSLGFKVTADSFQIAQYVQSIADGVKDFADVLAALEDAVHRYTNKLGGGDSPPPPPPVTGPGGVTGNVTGGPSLGPGSSAAPPGKTAWGATLVGGAAGFFIGGPVGAVAGATGGYLLGMVKKPPARSGKK